MQNDITVAESCGCSVVEVAKLCEEVQRYPLSARQHRLRRQPFLCIRRAQVDLLQMLTLLTEFVRLFSAAPI
jgi:hypothetical protein